MKISTMIKNLQEFMNKNGDLECYYAVDDEGNGYQPVFYAPSKFYIDEDGDVIQFGDIIYNGVDISDCEPICIIN